MRLTSLSRSKDFEILRAHGHSIHITSWLLVNVQKTEFSVFRCGWTLPRQIGTAVLRNRFRRWGREYLRKWAKHADKGLDLNLVFKRKDKSFYKSLDHKEFDEALQKMVGKIERRLE